MAVFQGASLGIALARVLLPGIMVGVKTAFRLQFLLSKRGDLPVEVTIALWLFSVGFKLSPCMSPSTRMNIKWPVAAKWRRLERSTNLFRERRHTLPQF